VAIFEDGSEVHGELLVAADGIWSQIRAQLLGANRLKYAGYTVWRGVAQYSLTERIGVTSIGRGAQFGMFPMRANRVYWFASANAQEADVDWGIGRKSELLLRFCDWHRPIADIIKATAEESIIRTDIYDHDPLKRWSCGRVTLLGDAAHPAAPTMGQGACQAIEDAVVLAACLGETGDIQLALRRYESRRKGRTAMITLQSRRFGRMGCWKTSLACWFRDRLIGSIPDRIRLRQLNEIFSFNPCEPVDVLQATIDNNCWANRSSPFH
jgi:2-polyprenyl-6-methoxyphenol hydroxylase-like FAD-dependent oxidoreductase